MGDRRQIVLEYGKGPRARIYLYTHWGGSNLPVILRNALERGKDRWSDESYLGRIIASEVFNAAGIESTTGAGLSPYPQDSEYDDLYVYMDARQVVCGGETWPFGQFILVTDENLVSIFNGQEEEEYL